MTISRDEQVPACEEAMQLSSFTIFFHQMQKSADHSWPRLSATAELTSQRSVFALEMTQPTSDAQSKCLPSSKLLQFLSLVPALVSDVSAFLSL